MPGVTGVPGWAEGAGHLAVAPGTPGSSTSAATCRADRVPSQPPQADNRTAFKLTRSGLLAARRAWPGVNVVTAGWSGPGRQVEHLAGTVALADHSGRETGWVTSSGRSSVFAGFRFPQEVIAVAVRWYLRYGLSYRDAGGLLAERGITVDHVTIYR